MKLSILTPTYSCREDLIGCIENVAKQIHEGVEHIIVDGGSTDGSVEVLSEACARYAHVRWISEPDEGQADAMNKALELAKGDFIGTLNVDDRYEPSTLAKILHHISQLSPDPRPHFLLGICHWWLPDGTLLAEAKAEKFTFLECLLGRFPPNPVAYFYEKKLHEQIGNYSTERSPFLDYDFLLGAVRAVKVHYYNELWGHFLMGEDCQTYKLLQRGGKEKLEDATRAPYLKSASIETKLLFRLLYWEKRKGYGAMIRAHLRHPRMIGGRLKRILFR